ncbi:MAG: hypothetical protein GXP47_00595, partial [Acidobacteria bacterium]|nr:hypothetical protein [Acidobacteriota bacterium]
PGGRFGEAPSRGLSSCLEALGLRLLRFKTGTPPRLHRESIDFDRLEVQAGDAEPRPFSWRTREVCNRVVCWVTRRRCSGSSTTTSTGRRCSPALSREPDRGTVPPSRTRW